MPIAAAIALFLLGFLLLAVPANATWSILIVDTATGEALWFYEAIQDLGPFHRARGIKADSDMVRFSTQGAYYVPEGHAVLE